MLFCCLQVTPYSGMNFSKLLQGTTGVGHVLHGGQQTHTGRFPRSVCAIKISTVLAADVRNVAVLEGTCTQDVAL
jgi:hypothetical protein